MNAESVTIIGAGWAGLASAIKLTQQGYRVNILESARQAGGRARSVLIHNHHVDNGQHLLIGAYTECLNLIKTVGIDPQSGLKRLPLSLTVIDKSNQQFRLKAASLPLPAPLHLFFALITAKGLTIKQRFSAIRFGLYLRIKNYKLEKDISVSDLLQLTRQPEILIRQLWEPLCLAIMNTSIKDASANTYMRVFKDAFTLRNEDANLLLPTVNLSELFPDAAVNYIEKHGGKVHFKSRVEKIEIINNQVKAVQIKNATGNTETINTSRIIIATAPQNLKKLISEHPVLESLTKQIEKFKYEPIVTVYLLYPEKTKLPQPMIGMSSTLTHWVFDRESLCQQAGLLSVIISAQGEHMDMDDATLADKVHNEIVLLFSLLQQKIPVLKDYFIIREKRATFACTVNVNQIRPQNKTPVKGLSLAGDYTDTGYPATLEGAVRSGLCAGESCFQDLS